MSEFQGKSGNFQSAYLTLYERGELERRVERAYDMLKNCNLCARYCHVNRLETIEGAVCRTGERAIVHSFGPHHGEEEPLRGQAGSGTIFFSLCNLRCVYCQNWEISQKGAGHEVDAEALAAMMINLQKRGCHNINFVTPSHVVAQILEAVLVAARQGLRLPLVYNTGGYDSPEALALLDGVIDIYMPDMKYGDSEIARRYSHVPDYWEINQAAVREMFRQVGDLIIDDRGVARRGLLVRHLVLPEEMANTEKVVAFLAGEISEKTYLNLMDQYHPCYRADEHQPINSPVTQMEYNKALALAEEFGLQRFDQRQRFSR